MNIQESLSESGRMCESLDPYLPNQLVMHWRYHETYACRLELIALQKFSSFPIAHPITCCDVYTIIYY